MESKIVDVRINHSKEELEWKWRKGLLLGVLLGSAIASLLTIGQVRKEVQTAPPEREVITIIRYATEEEQAERDRQMVEALAQTVWGEARGCSTTEQAAIVWCILNRADDPGFPDDPLMVAQQAGQFDGYDPGNPVEPEMVKLVEDVLSRWEAEDNLVGNVGRVLPREYLFFEGDGAHNHFRTDYVDTGETWDWSLPSPY